MFHSKAHVISENQIGDAGAARIGEALEKNTTLATLDLYREP